MGEELVSVVAGCGGLLLVLVALVAADVRWDLERLPNGALCLIVGAGFALVGGIVGGIAAGGDWGTALAAACIIGGIALVAMALAAPPFAHNKMIRRGIRRRAPPSV